MNRLPGLVIVTCWWWVLSLTAAVAAEKFIIMTPGPSVPYTPLHYGVDAGFFKEQGIDLQVVAIRAGQIGVASLTSGGCRCDYSCGDRGCRCDSGLAGEAHFGKQRAAQS
jgi:ABC-type nitrate/sulfonate/bicarbonate transport system substrate-binding protein